MVYIFSYVRDHIVHTDELLIIEPVKALNLSGSKIRVKVKKVIIAI
jgi:hypothetical protein